MMRRWTNLILLAAVTAAAIADSGDDTPQLSLRRSVQVADPVVTLGDVLRLDDVDAAVRQRIADAPLASDIAHATTLIFTHDQIAQRLAELGVNLAEVLVVGSLSCEVRVDPPASETVDNDVAEPDRAGSALLVADHQPVPREAAPTDLAAGTLRAALARHIAGELGVEPRSLELHFERATSEYLDLTTDRFEFRIRGLHNQPLGFQEYTVAISQDGRRQHRVTIGVRVRARVPMLVAARSIGIGTTIRRTDIEYAERLLESGPMPTRLEPANAIGQNAKRYIEAGELLTNDLLEEIDLIRRNDRIGVTTGDRVNVRMPGVALDSGKYGERIRVRIGASRNNWREVAAVVMGVGQARLVRDGRAR